MRCLKKIEKSLAIDLMSAIKGIDEKTYKENMNKYCLALEFPCPDNCNEGEVDFVEVEAKSEDEAIKKAKLKVIHRIKVNKVTELKLK